MKYLSTYKLFENESTISETEDICKDIFTELEDKAFDAYFTSTINESGDSEVTISLTAPHDEYIFDKRDELVSTSFRRLDNHLTGNGYHISPNTLSCEDQIKNGVVGVINISYIKHLEGGDSEARMVLLANKIYTDINDITQDLTDDGFTIGGEFASNFLDWHPNHKIRFLRSFTIKIYKTNHFGDNIGVYLPFRLDSAKGCVDHLISYMSENGYDFTTKVISESGFSVRDLNLGGDSILQIITIRFNAQNKLLSDLILLNKK